MSWKAIHRVRIAGIGFLIFAVAIGLSMYRCEQADAAGPESNSEFCYCLELEGTVVGYFLNAFNMGSETELIEMKKVNRHGNLVYVKLPGKVKFSDITLRKGVSSTLDLKKWSQMVANGKNARARKNGSICLYDKSHQVVARWNLTKAWPKVYTGNQTKSGSAANATQTMSFESITLGVEKVERLQ
jgi:phage tail-like protein